MIRTKSTGPKFTPGPWAWLNYPDGRKLLLTANRAVIHCPDAPIEIEEADQVLIAAAPHLFAALKALCEADPGGDRERQYRAAVALIAEIEKGGAG